MKQPKKKTHPKRNSLDTLNDLRDRALERVIDLWEKGQDDVIEALDDLTLAHLAATFEFYK
jgi:hypothetical protein